MERVATRKAPVAPSDANKSSPDPRKPDGAPDRACDREATGASGGLRDLGDADAAERRRISEMFVALFHEVAHPRLSSDSERRLYELGAEIVDAVRSALEGGDVRRINDGLHWARTVQARSRLVHPKLGSRGEKEFLVTEAERALERFRSGMEKAKLEVASPTLVKKLAIDLTMATIDDRALGDPLVST
jgi:hypothetical protein